MMKNKFFIFWILSNVIFPTHLVGQMDTVVQIPAIEIIAPRVQNQSIGGQTTTWKTTDTKGLSASNLGELLHQQSNIFIKSYGQGSLATSSIRGGSASHTLVLWNGLPIQSPMLGLLDFSLIPTNGFEEIALQKGGNSAYWGSGAIGGVIGLSNQADFYNKIFTNVQTNAGSFGYIKQQVNFGFGNQRFQSATKLFYERTDNDFEYEIHPDLPKRKLTNAHFSKQNLLQDFYWKINSKQLVAAHLWLQKSDVEIPPNLIQPRSEAHQDDYATRIILDWKRLGTSWVWNAKAAFFDEQQDYFNDLANFEANNDFKIFLGEISGQWNWKNHQKLLLGATHTFNKATSKGYGGSVEENKAGLFFSYQILKSKFQLQTSLRQEWVDEKSIPLIPSVGINYQVISFLHLKFKAGKNYRLPTLNERFWQPGGNENLLPESGWSEELSLESEFGKGNLKCKYIVTAFNRNMENWIQWLPRTGELFWSANNISKVWSRGLEQRFSIFYKKNKMQIQWDVGYDYILSTYEVALKTPKIEKGTQLLYTPKYQGFTSLKFGWQNFSIFYRHQLVGKNQGVNGLLSTFDLGSIKLQHQLKIKKCKSIVFFQVNNIWNEEYLVISKRPMPLSNYQLGINFLFQKKSKSNLL